VWFANELSGREMREKILITKDNSSLEEPWVHTGHFYKYF
jgi:hypothetical protein